MIGRMWRGRTDADQANDYEAVFRGVVLPELRDVAGRRGAYLLRRDDVDGAEFVSLTSSTRSTPCVPSPATSTNPPSSPTKPPPSSATSTPPRNTSPSS